MAGFGEEIAPVLEEALSFLAGQDSGLRARLMAELGYQLRWYWDQERSESLCREAIEMARRVRDHLALTRALTLGEIVLGPHEEVEYRLATTDEAVRLAEEIGDKVAEALGRWRRLSALIQLADADAVDREIEIQARLAEELRQPQYLANAASINASRAIWQGRLADARRFSWEARSYRTRVFPGIADWSFGLQLYSMRRQQGRIGETLPALQEGSERFPTIPLWRCLLTCAYAEAGYEPEARLEFDKLAENGFSIAGRDAYHALNLGLLADACAALRDEERAEQLYDRLLQYKGRCLVSNPMLIGGSAARPLGLLANTMDRWDDAVGHFDDALEIDKQMRALGWLPRTQSDYARMLLDRNAPGDRRKALDLLGEAIATSQELGLKGFLDMALELKLRAQGVDSGSVTTSIDLVASSVGDRRPDLGRHAAPDGTVTLMFSDMEGFTAMTERLGDLKAREVIRDHNSIVREHLAKHGGYEVELQGDGFLLAFGSARQGLLCAIEIQRAFEEYNAGHPDEPIRVRIGLHTGEVLKDADKFFGRTVILAARIAAQARGGEILTSSLLKELTESVGDLRFGKAREVELKGISERQRLFAVEWQ
jgi:class 3 adenylate cyclase